MKKDKEGHWLIHAVKNASGKNKAKGRKVAQDDNAKHPLDTASVLAGIPEGRRNKTLFRWACKLRYLDLPQDMAEKLILEAASRCVPPFDPKIALQKVRPIDPPGAAGTEKQ